ncbi:MAG: LCP family protein [Lachnospiraceae bacterium]|nr:LCP family protein [Lachnospiraceae bacterium]
MEKENREDAENETRGRRRTRSKERKRRHRGIGFFLCVFLLLLQIAVSVIMCLEVYQLGLLPDRYLGVVILVLLLMAGIEIGLILQHSRAAYAIAGVFAVCFTFCLSMGTVYARKTDETLQSISATTTTTQLDEVLVTVLADSGIDSLDELAGRVVGIQASLDRDNTDTTIESLSSQLDDNLTVEEYNGIADMVQALYDGGCEAIVYNEAYQEMITDSFETFEEDVVILNTYTYTTTVEVEADTDNIRENFELEEEPFIVYLSGIDKAGDVSVTSRSDVNILAVVNPATRQILLVTTPRDYYVSLPFEGDCMDKLTHAGIYGIDCSIETLENLYEISVDYYLRVNFTGFVDIVDALGGVSVYSEQAFTSEVGNYDFVVGYNEVDGDMALGFVRERHSFTDGDYQRARNQMAMIEAIVEKATSPSILTSYTSVLESLEGSFTTDMTTDDIATLVKMCLEDDSAWNIETYSVTGTSARMSTYSMGSQQLYVILQDEESIAEAQDLIQRVWDGEIIDLETETEEGSSEESSEALETSSEAILSNAS